MNDSRRRRLFGAAGRHLAATPVKWLLWEAKRMQGEQGSPTCGSGLDRES